MNTFYERMWSKPYCGVSHLGEIADLRWATITQWDSFVELTRWLKGSRPIESTFDTLAEAKAAGEGWVAEART